MKRRGVRTLRAPSASLLVLFACSAGCRDDEASFGWPPPLSDRQARAVLESECMSAGAQRRPLLVEFSAPWCEHCQDLERTLRDPELSRRLADFHTLVLNIGNGDQLDDLRRELEARAIPAWVVVEPTGCDTEPRQWQRLANTYPRGDARRLVEFLQPFGGS